jgi:hypothetical protein
MKREITWVEIDSIEPYDRNPRRNVRAIKAVGKSLQEFGFNQPIVVDQNSVIVVGHTRHRAAKDIGMLTVPVIQITDLSENQLRAYRIADNKLNELAEWDDDLLRGELQELLDVGLEDTTGFGRDEIDRILNSNPQSDNPYTTLVDTPIYTPTGERPSVTSLYDNGRVDGLLTAIDRAEIDESVKVFLRLAAHRHREFDYRLIAEYYAHATAEVQKLMEDSALVIIDFDRAIELGYVKLTDDLKQAHQQDYPDA